MKKMQIASSLSFAWKTFSKREKRRLLFVLSAQAFSSVLDLLGVALIGVVVAVSISGVASRQPGSRVYQALTLIGLDEKSLQFQVTILSIIAVCTLLLKTYIGVKLTKKWLLLMSNKAAEVTTNLFSKKLSSGILELQSISSQRTLYSITVSVVALIVGVLGTAATIVSDVILALVLVIALIAVDPLMALFSTIFFGAIGFGLFFKLGKKSQELGLKTSKLEVESNILILQAFDAYRETVIGNKQGYYIRALENLRRENASVISAAGYIPFIGKYVIETALVLAAFLLSAIQFYLYDAMHAIATLTVFLAAGGRLAPAILRIQQSAISVKNSQGMAQSCIEILKMGVDRSVAASESLGSGIFLPRVSLKKVNFTYPGNHEPALKEIDLEINEGKFVAIVGPSGGGKSTLVDTILGVLHPQSGEVLISGVDPLKAHKVWPGKTAYVPQQITIFDISIYENVALGVPREKIDQIQVELCLEKAQLAGYITRDPAAMYLALGEKGNRLSGGQRQRIGIARALYSNPELIVLDEATSALDAETEKAISDSFRTLREGRTTIVVAHRLSTIREADVIYYVDKGEVLAKGNFDDLKRLMPAFERQAHLSGIF